jgi:hypothetical protein
MVLLFLSLAMVLACTACAGEKTVQPSFYYLRTEDVTSATPSASSVSLICHEKLTDLNKAGHIISVINHSHGSDWIALMDDSCIYRIYIK